LIVTLFAANSLASGPVSRRAERLKPILRPQDAPWLANAQVNDPAPGAGTTQNSPALAAGSTGMLYASWLDYRDSVNQPNLYLAASGDSGAHWNTSARVNGALPADPTARATPWR
jgi:hypothetical protein